MGKEHRLNDEAVPCLYSALTAWVRCNSVRVLPDLLTIAERSRAGTAHAMLCMKPRASSGELFRRRDVSEVKISKVAPGAPFCGAGDPIGMPTIPATIGANKMGCKVVFEPIRPDGYAGATRARKPEFRAI